MQGGKGRQAPPFVMQLDVEVEAPTFVLPRCTDSSDHMRVNLGSLGLSNAVSWALDDGTAQHQARTCQALPGPRHQAAHACVCAPGAIAAVPLLINQELPAGHISWVPA